MSAGQSACARWSRQPVRVLNHKIVSQSSPTGDRRSCRMGFRSRRACSCRAAPARSRWSAPWTNDLDRAGGVWRPLVRDGETAGPGFPERRGVRRGGAPGDYVPEEKAWGDIGGWRRSYRAGDGSCGDVARQCRRRAVAVAWRSASSSAVTARTSPCSPGGRSLVGWCRAFLRWPTGYRTVRRRRL